MSKADTFFTGLTAFLDALSEGARNGPVVQVFEVGDTVQYEGSKIADHGQWVVKAVDDDADTVTLGRRGEWRMLKCSQRAVRHAAAERSLY